MPRRRDQVQRAPTLQRERVTVVRLDQIAGYTALPCQPVRVVRALADEVIVMKDGKVVEAGAADDIFEAPKTAYTKALMAAAFDLEVANEDAVRT